ncbi:MAG: hypothetical protein JWO49_1209 [Arthrobacter sp.]|nr:hypothetical protein [Arthrobacter sp.]MCU1548621.1 hypothetical protein [Arthrobacter sp.]
MAEKVPKTADGPKARYEAILRPGAAGSINTRRVADLDMDRVPDPDGGVRLLVDMDEVARLVESGFEVTLVQAAPAGPLDPSLVLDDDAARAWLDERLRGLERGGQD